MQLTLIEEEAEGKNATVFEESANKTAKWND